MDTLKHVLPDTVLLAILDIQTPSFPETFKGLDVSDWVTLVSALVGVVIGAMIGGLANRRAQRRDMTYSMHREFFGTEMGKVRFDARIRIPAVVDKTLLQLLDDRANADKNMPIWMMLRFYQRLSLMVKNNEVQGSIIWELFGGSYEWWYSIYLKDAFGTEQWAFGDHLKYLRERLVQEGDRQIRKERIYDMFRPRKKKLAPVLIHQRDVITPAFGKRGRETVCDEAKKIGVTPWNPVKPSA